MFGKLKRRVEEFANKVVSVSPSASRPAVETFKELWNLVQEEHTELLQRSNVNLDDPKLLQKTNIPDNLDAMVSILIREDWGIIRDSNGSISSGAGRLGEQGPLKACLEFTLENRVFTDLCAKGLADRPQGMMSLILVTIHRIIEKVRHPLLPYKTAHQPLCQLIRVSAEVGNERARERLVALLKTLWLSMRNDPSQLTFFFTPATSTRQEGLDMFLGLLPFLLENSETGTRARHAALCATSICDKHLLEYIAHHTRFCQVITEGLCSAFTELVNAMGEEGRTQQQRKEKVEAAESQLEITWKFANAVSVPGLSPLALDVDTHWMEAMKREDGEDGAPSSTLAMLSNEDEDARIFETVSTAVVKAVHKTFVMGTVVPALLETSETVAKNAMLGVVTMLDSMVNSGQELQSQLLWSFVSTLISTRLEPDSRDMEAVLQESSSAASGELSAEDQIDRLQTILLFRLDSMSAPLSTATLKLFSSLLDLNDPRILHCLVLRQLYPGYHLKLAASDGVLNDVKTPSDPFTTPKKQTAGSSDSSTPRTPGGRLKGGNAVEFLEKYPGSPKPPSLASVKKRKSINSQESKELVAFEAYLTDGQRQAAAKIAAFSSHASSSHTKHASPAKPVRRKKLSAVSQAEKVWASVVVDPNKPFSEGLFLGLLFNKLERMLDSSLEENLILTGIWSKLAQCPHYILHSFLFQEELALSDFLLAQEGEPNKSGSMNQLDAFLLPKEGVRTLSGVLAAVWKDALERAEDLQPEFYSTLQRVRVKLGVDPVFDEKQGPSVSATTALLFGQPSPSPQASSSRGSGPSSPSSIGDDNDDFGSDLYSLSKVRFAQSYVVLEEFLKELASTLQAKQNLVTLQQELAAELTLH